MRRRSTRGLVLSLLATVAAVIPAATSQARPQPPGLRLISAVRHADVFRFPGDPNLFIPTGVYVAPTGGGFEVDVTAKADGTVTLSQVQRNSDGVRLVRQLSAPGPVSIGDGLPAFFHASLRDSAGKEAASGDTGFCPSSWSGQARVDGTGPDRASYPYVCGSALTQATAWGIDQGWAAPVTVNVPAPSGPDGNYTLTISINEVWAKQLQLPPGATSAQIVLTLTTQTIPPPCPPDIPCRPATRSAETARRGSEGPDNVRGFERKGNEGRDGPGGLPNLAALPAHSFATEHNPDDGHDYLDFGATIWNAGPGPFVVEGFRGNDAPTMTAVQFIYRDAKAAQSATIGRFEFDRRPGHNHWHMADVAQYDLLDQTANQVVASTKQSFCLAPTDPVNLLAAGADWQPDRIGLFSACAGEESIWLREVLPSGWGDTYLQSVAGQSFDITNLANGTYKVRVTTNPFHRILETTFADNTSLAAVTIGGKPGQRTVTPA
jgi:hypothetical protein